MASPIKQPPHAVHLHPAPGGHHLLPPLTPTHSQPNTPTIPGQTATSTPHGSPSVGHSSGLPPPGSMQKALSTGSSSDAGSKAPQRKVGKYILGKTLGQGTFGKVRFATDSESGRHVAIKMMDKAKIRANNMGEQIKKEISIMKLLRHPSIIQLIEVLASSTTIYIVLELVTGGELFDKIIEEGHFDEDEARHYFQQLIGGIAQCHALGVAHRDLKPENLLLDDDGNLKISDFGLSTLSSDMQGDLLHTTCGTPNYVAPEVLMDKGYDGRAADVWSSGVILYVLLAGFLPFDESSMVELFRKIVKADFAYPSTLSPEAISLLGIILNPDPEKRATIDQIRAHPWYRGMTSEELEQEEIELAEQQALLQHNDPSSASSSLASHNRAPSDTATDASQAITWLEDKKNGGGGGGGKSAEGVAASPQSDMRPLQLDPVIRVISAGTTPTGPFLSPKADASPGASPALGPQSASYSSAHGSPTSGSMQARTRSKGTGASLLTDADSDPLGLDDEEFDIKGPIPLNAFDLINMVGGAAMGRMFQRGNDKKVRTFTQFTTNLTLDEIRAKLEEVLRALPETAFRSHPKQCIFKASRSTPRGKILGSCQLYQMTPKLFMVEWRKLKGDVFMFHQFFTEVKRRFTGQIDTTPLRSPDDAYDSADEDESEQKAGNSKSLFTAANKR